jgi:hypothetical protein
MLFLVLVVNGVNEEVTGTSDSDGEILMRVPGPLEGSSHRAPGEANVAVVAGSCCPRA